MRSLGRKGETYSQILNRLMSSGVYEEFMEGRYERLKDKRGRPASYVALRNSRPLVKASSLRELAEELKKAGINARDVEIRSPTPVPTVEKLGLRIVNRSK